MGRESPQVGVEGGSGPLVEVVGVVSDQRMGVESCLSVSWSHRSTRPVRGWQGAQDCEHL